LKTGKKLDESAGVVLYHKTARDKALKILGNDGFDAKESGNVTGVVHFYNRLEVNRDGNYIFICKLSEDARLFEVTEDYGEYVRCGEHTPEFEKDGWCKRMNDAKILEYGIWGLKLIEIIGFGCPEQRELRELIGCLSLRSNAFLERKFEKDQKSRESMILRDLHLPSIVEEKISQLISGAEVNLPLILEWNIQSLETFVTKINNYQGNFPCPFVLPVVLDTDSFRDALLEYWRGGVGAVPPKIGKFFLPYSASKAMTLMAFISNVAANPWWNDVNNVNAPNSFPLAYLYTLRARSAEGQLIGIYPNILNHPWQ
jgi:hypothetical protein